jgi:uncharacterized protein
MSETLAKKSIPIMEGLFTWPSDKPQLIGTKCVSCNTIYFPNKQSCNNPKCKEKKVQEILLSTEGTLWSYTIMRYPPAPPFKIEQKAPFPVGFVELSEGIRILGLITGCTPENLSIGMKMKLVVESLFTNDEGQEVVTWKFTPVMKAK